MNNHSDILKPDLRSSGDPELGEFAPVGTRIFHALVVKQSSLSSNIGKGVFTRGTIKSGSIIVIGGGQVVSDISKAPKDKDYIGVFDDKYYIAPLDFDSPTPNWLINHSCDANTKIIGRLVIIARRDIEAGEELTLDYATIAPCIASWSMECKCGSVLCRKVITNEDWMKRDTFHKYFEEWPSFIQQKGITLFGQDK